MTDEPTVTIRNDMRSGDVGRLVRLHGALYSREHGFDRTFERYVEEPLSAFASSHDHGERIWIMEIEGSIKGCIAVVRGEGASAQLRWFLLNPDLRGRGLGWKLLNVAIGFARENGYRSMFLWTVGILEKANRLYVDAGFRLTEERTLTIWGRELTEQRYELAL